MAPGRGDSDVWPDDSLLVVVETILAHDIPDPNRRRAVALILNATTRNRMTRALREHFDPYIGADPVELSGDDAVKVMRDTVMMVAGHGRHEEER